MIASRPFAASVSSIAAWATGVAAARAAVHAGSLRPPVASASSKIREFQSDSGAPDSSSGLAALKSIRSWSVFG
jgi:hypothetical protein